MSRSTTPVAPAPAGAPTAPHRVVRVRSPYTGLPLAAVLPPGHPARVAGDDVPDRWGAPAVALTAAGLAAGALAAGAALAFLDEAAVPFAAAAVTLLFGALWVRLAARPRRHGAAPRAVPRPAPVDGAPLPPRRERATSPAALVGYRPAARTAGVASALLLLTGPAAVAAQQAPAALRNLSVALGGDVGGVTRGDGFGRSLLVGYDVLRRSGAHPLGVRVTGTLLDRAGPERASRFGGLGVDLSLTFRDLGPVRPYLLAGGGVYRLREAPDGPSPVSATRTTGALVGGAGVRVPVGRAALFTEARYTAFASSPGRGSYVPLVVGLRF